MQRRIIVLILVVLCIALPAWAEEADSGVWETKIVEVNGYSFEIQELLRDDLAIERRYINPTPDVQIEDVEQAKALLIALGMDAENVALWSDASLLAALNGKEISMAVADYRVDEESDVVSPIVPEIADNGDVVVPVHTEGASGGGLAVAATGLWGMLLNIAMLIMGAVILLELWRVKRDLAELKAVQEKANVEHKED